jgi:virginiamycin B lyase
MAGEISEFAISTTTTQPYGIAAGPDGALWITPQATNNLIRITTTGAVTTYTLAPLTAGDLQPHGIATGPDGCIWFTEMMKGRIGRLSP